MAGCFKSQEKRVFLVTLHSEIWGETEKPGRMIDALAFIGDDNQGLPNCVMESSRTACYRVSTILST